MAISVCVERLLKVPVPAFPAANFLNFAIKNKLRLYNHPCGYAFPSQKGFKTKMLDSSSMSVVVDDEEGWKFERWSVGELSNHDLVYHLLMYSYR